MGVSDLPEETKRALQDVLTRRGRDLLDEAGRLEAEANSGLGVPMITPAMIVHADTWQRMGYTPSRISTTARNWLMMSTLATLIAGYFTNNITEPWGAIGFVVCAIATLASFSKGSQS